MNAVGDLEKEAEPIQKHQEIRGLSDEEERTMGDCKHEWQRGIENERGERLRNIEKDTTESMWG